MTGRAARPMLLVVLLVALAGCGGDEGGGDRVAATPQDVLVAHVAWLRHPGAAADACTRLAGGSRGRLDRLAGLLRPGGRCPALERETVAQLLTPPSGSRAPGRPTVRAAGDTAIGTVPGWRAQVPLVREAERWRVQAGGDRAVRWRISQSLACTAYGRDSGRAPLPTASPGGWLLAAEAQERRLAAYLRTARRARPPAALRGVHRDLVRGLDRVLRAQRSVRRLVNDGVPPGTAETILYERVDRALRRVRRARRDGGVVCWQHPLRGTPYADRAQAACRREDDRTLPAVLRLMRAASPGQAAAALRQLASSQRRLARALRPLRPAGGAARDVRRWRTLHAGLVADLRSSGRSLDRLAAVLARGRGAADPYGASFRAARAEAAAARLGLDDCTAPTPISPTDGAPPRRGKQPGVSDSTPV